MAKRKKSGCRTVKRGRSKITVCGLKAKKRSR